MGDIISDWGSGPGGVSCLQNGDVATLACIPIVLQNIINSLVIIAGVACVFIIIFSGYKYVTSEGDPEKIAMARKTLLYGIGGFLFILASFLVLNIISNFTGVEQIAPK